MNSTHPIHITPDQPSTGRTLKHFLALVGVAFVFGMTGCNVPGFGHGKAIRSLEEQVAGLLTVQQQIEERLGLWQVAAAIFIVLAGFALVGGAALGSRARRLRDQHRGQGQGTPTQTQTEAQPATR